MDDKQVINSNQRLLYVDWAKLLGIYLVILAHLNLRNNVVNLMINSFHMPLFFLLSGICYKPGNVINDLKKNSKGLLIPYISLQVLCYPYFFMKSYFQNHIELNIMNYIVKPFFGFIYGVVYDTSYSSMIIGATWFLMALFFIKFLASVLVTRKKETIGIVIIFFVIVAMLLKTFNIMLPWSINCAFLGLPVFLFGYYFKDYIKRVTQLSVLLKIIISCLCCCALYSITNMNGLIHVGDAVWGNNIFLYYIDAVLGSLTLIIIASFFHGMDKFCKFLAKNTMLIMCFEVYTFAPFKYIYMKFFDISVGSQDYMPLWYGILVALVALVACSVPCYIINRWLPFCLGKKRI